MTQRIGKYDILTQLTRGGMAEVLLGCTSGPGDFRKYVVIKRILPGAAEDESFVQMFLDEARITASLSHASIAQLFDLGEDRRGGLFTAMEFIPGQNLNEVVEACARQSAVLPLGFSVSVVHDCALALHYAHTFSLPTGESWPVIHRDVAQKNIMVTYEGVAKLLDFGIAKATNAMTRTKAGQVKGTAGYMSPEQVRGEPLDGRSDVFSLGVVLWELVTGQRLFGGQSEVEELRQILGKVVPSPDSVEKSVPPSLARVTMKALERDVSKRHASARDFARALAVECSELFFSVEERADFMRERFAWKIEATRKLFEAAGGTDTELEAAAQVYRSSASALPKGDFELAATRVQGAVVEAPAAKVEAPAAKVQAPAAKVPPPRKRATKAPRPAKVGGHPALVKAEDWEPVPAWRTAKNFLQSRRGVAAAVAGVVVLGLVVAWSASRSPEPLVRPRATVLPGVKRAEAVDASTAAPEGSPVEAGRAEEEKAPGKSRGVVTLVLSPEATVWKGKQRLGEGTMIRFSLPTGTHLVTVVGPDGVRRKLSVRVRAGQNPPLKLKVSELPRQ